MRFSIIIILIFSLTANLISQNKVDSLQSLLKKYNENRKPKVLNELSAEFLNINLEESYQYAIKAKELAEKYKNKPEEAASYKNIASFYYYQKNLEKALDFYKKSLEIKSSLNDKDGAAALYFNIGFIYRKWGSYDKALENYNQSLSLYSESGNDVEKASVLGNIGLIYYQIGEYDRAISNYTSSLEIYEKLNDDNGKAKQLQRIGIIYQERANYEMALKSYQDALKIYQKLEDRAGIANTLNNIGIVYKDWGKFTDKEFGIYEQKALEFLNESMKIMEEIGNKLGVANSLSNIGGIYQKVDSIDLALDYYHRAIKIEDEINDKEGASTNLENIGVILGKEKNDYKNSLIYLNKSLQNREEIGNKQGIASSLHNIASIYMCIQEYNKAIEFLDRSIILAHELKKKDLIKDIYDVYSGIYDSLGNYKLAYKYFKKYTSVRDSIYTEESHKQFAEMEAKFENEKKQNEIELLNNKQILQTQRIENQQQMLVLATIGLIVVLIFAFLLYRQFSQKKKANILLALQKKELEKLSIVASETDNSVVIASADGSIEWVNEGFTRLLGYTFDEYIALKGKNLFNTSANPYITEALRKSIENRTSAVYSAEMTRKNGEKIWLQTTLTPIFNEFDVLIKLVAIDSDITKIKDAEEEIRKQKEEIQAQRDLATSQRDMITIQKKEITDSIHYARRIQTAIMPPREIISQYLPEHFIFYKPRDIVSGDFFWMTEKNNQIIIAAADCTGHGVPGAFMSLLGVAFLNEIVNKFETISSEQILNQLREYIIKSLHQKSKSFADNDSKQDSVKDGMDMSLIIIDENKQKLQFSGAYNPIYLIRKTQDSSLQDFDNDSLNFKIFESSNSTLVEIKGDKMPIGLHYNDDYTSFTKKEIKIFPKDSIYLFSDGLPDQFGVNGKKFKYQRFKKLLLENNSKPMIEQKNILDSAYCEWKGDVEQIDDILIIGLQI